MNHRGRSGCPNPQICDHFTIIDVNAIHSVQLKFCACGQGTQSHYVQLLRAGLFPVTNEDPKTAITFQTLKLYEILSYESKVSVFEYHRTLTRLTDNTGISTPPVRFYPNPAKSVTYLCRTATQPSTVQFGYGGTSKC